MFCLGIRLEFNATKVQNFLHICKYKCQNVVFYLKNPIGLTCVLKDFYTNIIRIIGLLRTNYADLDFSCPFLVASHGLLAICTESPACP